LNVGLKTKEINMKGANSWIKTIFLLLWFFSVPLWQSNLFFGSFDLYQDKNEHNADEKQIQGLYQSLKKQDIP